MSAGSRHVRGFTLIELLITLLVAGVLVTIAAPSFQRLMASNQHATDYNAFLSGLTLARSEAIKRREPVEFFIDSGSAPWLYRIVLDNGDVVRIRESTNVQVTVKDEDGAAFDDFPVKFDSLGRVEAGSLCAGGCDIFVTAAIKSCSININSFGRISRGECNED